MATYCVPRDPLAWFGREGSTGPLERVYRGRSCRAAEAKAGLPHPWTVSAQRRAPMPAPGVTQPTPEPLVVGTALSIDSGASGNPVSRARGAQRQRRWLSRSGRPTMRAARQQPLGQPLPRRHGRVGQPDQHRGEQRRHRPTSISRSTPAATRRSCGTSLARSSVTKTGVVMSARFDAGAGAWATPVLLSTDAVASRASPAMPPAPCSPCTWPVVRIIRGRFFDPVSGTWQPEADDRAEQHQHRLQRRPGAIAGRQRQCARRLPEPLSPGTR